MDDEIRFLDRQFKVAFREMDIIQTKIYQQQGVWIFKYHAYSQKELLKSEHHAKIYAVVEAIGSNIKNWERTGKTSRAVVDAYYIYRDETDENLHRLNLAIYQRSPTWWESFGQTCDQFRDIVMAHLPEVVRVAIEATALEITKGLFHSLSSTVRGFFLTGRAKQAYLPESKTVHKNSLKSTK